MCFLEIDVFTLRKSIGFRMSCCMPGWVIYFLSSCSKPLKMVITSLNNIRCTFESRVKSCIETFVVTRTPEFGLFFFSVRLSQN
jgi:hypothetical protein